MSFHLATVNETNAPARATNFRTLRLGGPAGVIARFIAASGSSAESHWSISEEKLMELAGGRTGYDLVFFRPTKEPSADGSLEIYRLESLNGVASSDRTDVICLFTPLRMQESAAGVWDLESSRGRTLCEALSLTGGTAGGQWLWSESPMTLGATVVGGGCQGGCSDKPAGNCCGGGCH